MAALFCSFVSFFDVGCCAMRSESGNPRMSLAYSRTPGVFQVNVFFQWKPRFQSAFSLRRIIQLWKLIDTPVNFTTLTMSLGNGSHHFYVSQRAEYCAFNRLHT